MKWLALLHILLLVYSLGSVCSKLAAQQQFGSLHFVLLYGGLLLTLGIYAIGWQQVIKHLPLTTAYANKAVTVVWGMVYGALMFQEKITLRQLLGSAIIIAGVLLFIYADRRPTQ